MAGPGGGSRGGGFGGGGSRGGSFGGGSFGGGGGYRHHHYHRPGFFFWGPRRYYGGGCLGGLAGMIILPVIILILAGIFLIGSVISAFSIAGQGGVVSYDENKFGDYANARYEEEFGGKSGYEDNILIVFTTNEDYDEYYCIAWVGDHIVTEINYMFGNATTDFGRAVNSSINQQSYKYSLSSNLAETINKMTYKIETVGIDNSFKCNEKQAEVPSRLVNRSELNMTESTVDMALTEFTEKTGIPIVIVVDEEEDVFGKNMPAGVIFTIIISIVIIAIAGFSLFKAFKYRNGGPNDNNMFDDKNFES